ncbi:MAG: succinyl-diaminopimelate desuccinylase, partial [Candidatus Sericytochromatia bacterium]|nr:succinyl-diaminopimelate desuccinylase [Candidatus Tanganyikabacteria bacterium]
LSDAGTEACATDATGGAGLRAGRDAGAKSSEPRYDAALADLALELLRIPSVTGGEAAIAEFVHEQCTRRGAGSRRIGNCVVATRTGEAGGPRVGLFGHLDTVPPAADQPCGREDGRLFGCGSSDMKGALAVMLELLARQHRASLVAVFYDREEGPYLDNGLRSLLAAGALGRLDVALALEPTANAIQAGCLGGLHAEVAFAGRRAHSARPWQGENAIYKAHACLGRLAAFAPREVVVGGLSFREVMTATTAVSRGGRNVVPDRFVVNVNYRFAPGKSLEAARAEVADLVAGDGEIAFVDEAPAGDVAHDHPLLAPWRERHDLAVEPKQAWTDVAQLSEAGIPAINFGPGDPAQAHKAGEWVDVSALARSYRLLADLLA